MADTVKDALALIARHVQAFLDGNRRALHELCDILTSERFSEETVETALETIIELAAEEAELEEKGEPSGTSEADYNAERLHLSPEAYMYLVELRSSGAISSLAEEALMERVSSSASGEISLEDLQRALAEVSVDPSTSFLLSSEEGDPPTVH